MTFIGATFSFTSKRLKPRKQVGKCQRVKELVTGTGERHSKACSPGENFPSYCGHDSTEVESFSEGKLGK